MLKALLVKNEPKYWNFIGELRTNPAVQYGFVEQLTSFDSAKQERYMQKYDSCYWVGIFSEESENTKKNIPFGFVGIIDNDIRICVDPKFHNHGLGQFMLNELAIQTNLKDVVGRVKLENLSSQKMFLACGYQEIKQDENFKYYQLKK